MLYMRQLLNLKPNLLQVIVTRLDNQSSFDSLNSGSSSTLSDASFSPGSSSRKGGRQRRIQTERNDIMRKLADTATEVSQSRKRKASRECGVLGELKSLTDLIVKLKGEMELCFDEEEKQDLKDDIAECRKNVVR